MKIIIYTFLLFSITTSYSQEWTAEENEVLEKFSLLKDDHRGVIFVDSDSQCSESHKNINAAVLSFFTEILKKDVTVICVEGLDPNLKGITFGIKELVELYLRINK